MDGDGMEGMAGAEESPTRTPEIVATPSDSPLPPRKRRAMTTAPEGVEPAPRAPATPAKKTAKKTPAKRGRPVGRKTGTAKKAMPVRPRRDKGIKYDWYEIRTQFIEGFTVEGSDEREFVNLVELSKRLDIPLPTIRIRAADERWYDQREQYQLKVAKTRQIKRVMELAGQSVDFDSSALKVAKLGMGVVTTRMAEIAREVQEAQVRREEAMRQMQQGYVIDPAALQTVIDARELDTLSRAALQWQQVGQKAMGTDVQKIDVMQNIQVDVDVEISSISAELGRDDPERLAAFLQAAKRAGLLERVVGTPAVDTLALEASEDADGVIDAEIVSESA